MRIVSRRTAPGTSDMVEASIEPGDVNPFSVHKDPDSGAKSFGKRLLPKMDAVAFDQLIADVIFPCLDLERLS